MKCMYCGKQAGFLVEVCRECEPKYGDKVKITCGFYKGQIGKAVDIRSFGGTEYVVKLKDGKIVNAGDAVEKIK